MANAIALSFLCNGRKRRWCKCEARSIVTVRSETSCIPLLTSLLNCLGLRGAESLHARLNNANYSVEAYDEFARKYARESSESINYRNEGTRARTAGVDTLKQAKLSVAWTSFISEIKVIDRTRDHSVSSFGER